MVKATLAILAVLAFFTVAAFGFSAASHEHGINDIMCPAELVSGGKCRSMESLAVVAFHLDAFKNFTHGISGFSVFAALLLLAVLFVLAQPFISSPRIRLARPVFLQESNLVGVLSHKQFLRWFSLHENSPNAF